MDNRGRFSLNRLQLVLWTLVVISLVSGVFFGRLFAGVNEPLNFKIPEAVLGLLGVSVATGITVGAVKASKKTTSESEASEVPPERGSVVSQGARSGVRLATYSTTGRLPFFSQVFMTEEGSYADDTVDVTKFQGFAITVVLVIAYVAMAIHAVAHAKYAGNVTSLPDIKGTFLVLLAISYAGYAGGKLPTASGSPRRA